MSTDLNKSISIYRTSSCEQDIFYSLHEDYGDNFMRATAIIPLSSKLFFKTLDEFIEDYLLIRDGSMIFNLREGEAISYSEEDVDSSKCSKIVNKVIYHPNVKKINV